MFGVPSDSVDAIDMGKSRTVSDALSFAKDGFKIQNKTAFCAVVSTCHTLINGNAQPISVRIATEFADVIDSDGVMFAGTWSRQARESKIPNPSLVAGCMIMLWMHYRTVRQKAIASGSRRLWENLRTLAEAWLQLFGENA